MADSNHRDTAAPGAVRIHDMRSTPRGVLPRHLQMWLMIGLAVIIIAIIFLTGRPAPTTRASVSARPVEPALIAPDRIQSYQRHLAEQEARLRQELAKTAESAASAGSARAPRDRD